jgi:hypothetical protein
MTLHDELQRIADRAPVADVPDDTWARARGAKKRDLALTVAGVAAVLGLLAGAIAWLPDQAEPPVANTESLGVPDHLYAVTERMSDRDNDGSWMRDEVTDDPTVVGVGAAAWVTDQGLPVVVDAERGDYHLLDLPDFAGNNETFARGLGTPVVALSPDGRELAYGYAVFGTDAATEPIPSGVRVVDLTTGDVREIPVAGEEGTAVSHIAWSPDGRWLAFTGVQQSYWTAESMGTSEYLDSAGPVLGRIPPGATTATVRSTRDDVPLVVDDAGVVSFDQVSLGQVDDEISLHRADNELRLVPADGSEYPVGAVDPAIGDGLSIAVDLMPPHDPTVERPEPDWPWSEERLSITIGLGVAAAIALLLGLRRLWRHWRQSRAAR